MRNKPKVKSAKLGFKIICHSIKKQYSSIKKTKQKKIDKGQSKKRLTAIKQKQGYDIKMDMQLSQIPEAENLAFQFDAKNQCQKTVDYLLSQNLEQISQCTYIQQPFREIKQKKDTHNESDEESKIYEVYLHQVYNTENPAYVFGFISSVKLPELRELELFLRKDLEDYKSEVNPCIYQLKFISTISLSSSELLSIYNFNTGFFKDFQQEGNQISSYIFEYFMQSTISVKFLQVLLTQKYIEVELNNFNNNHVLTNFDSKKCDMEKEINENPYQFIDFDLIHNFNLQKKQKSILDNKLNLATTFINFSQDLQMIDETSKSDNLDKQNVTIIELINENTLTMNQKDQLIENENKLQDEVIILPTKQIEEFNLTFQKEKNKINDISDQEITQNLHDLKKIDVDSNNQQENTCSSVVVTEQNGQKQELVNDQNKQLQEIQQSEQDQIPENQMKMQDPTNQDQQQKPRVKLDGDLFQESEKLNNISLTLKNEKFRLAYQSNIYRHLFLNQDLYQIVEIFDPSNTTIDQFIQSLSQHTGMSYDSIKQKLFLKQDATQKDLQSDTLYDCIYSQPDKYLTDKAQMFFAIRKQFVNFQKKEIQQYIQDYQQQLIANNNIQTNQQTQNKYNQNTNQISQYHQFNRRNPLVLCRKINHLKNFDFLSDAHIKNNKGVFQSCLQKDFSDNKINMSLLPLEHFEQHVLNTQLINSHLQAPSIFALIKDVMIVRDFACNYFLENNVDLELLIESFSQISYSKTKNLELLEVIGDVVIKYISSLYLYLHLPNQSENALTMIRTIFINNKYLGISAFRNGLQFYVQTKRPSSYDWRFNLFNLNSFTEAPQDQKQSFQLSYSNLSDTLESVVGCFYASNQFTLNTCIQLIKDLGLQIDQYLLNKFQNQVNGSFVLSDDIIDLMEIDEEMTYYELQLQGKKFLQKEFEIQANKKMEQCFEEKIQNEIIQNEENTQFIWNLIKFYIKDELFYKNKYEVEFQNNTCPNQRRKDRSEYRKFKQLHEQTLDIAISGFEKILNYTFKDKSLLIKALNCHSNSNFEHYFQDYQILEFLGDALIEILVVSHGYHISRNRQKKINSPYFFCEMKSLLLSNDFMSRMAILNKFHYYALNISKYQQDEIIQFIEDCNLNTKFKESVSHQANSPKVLGDLWESVAGAIIMDSDISTFVSIYGKLYAPYIIHFVTFYQKIIFNVKEKVQLVAQQTYEQLGKITEVVKDTDGQYKVKVTILIKQIKVGTGIDYSETLAEKKAFQDAYDHIFIKQQSNLGLIFQGKQV
ncbi:dicer-related RNase III protein Dcl1p (macronuclear) [Tetrahymena thermophila SB210]|uniref:Dicer-related RNase III protein Dcl1p n=2 Tax=Tetrahymena thermophila TaxID=5911 RepID=I7MKB8_TETTS|nr:dicer-related RNase III protein Dcl1p [Tetrahymena thermophila SB210]EAR98031.2 dicer-related RNase III protein Dcl1p [Tetrahymena thermophila SB210]BAD34724.1 Dicer-related RNase III protein Dcl1p [Tetrahymena thermophila]|eukprot:XP_001018276.2 dicer-related RNase III protein Dcl1p [Tetrahymena thermophila SB210]